MAPYHISGRVLKPLHSQGDYCYVHLFDKDGATPTTRCIGWWQRLSCLIPRQLNEVNHIDEDKDNNRADNLEWCKHVDNCNYGTRMSGQPPSAAEPGGSS